MLVFGGDDPGVPRPIKPDEKKRKKIGLTLAPETFVLLPLIGEKLDIDTLSRVVDELVKAEARRLKIRPKA